MEGYRLMTKRREQAKGPSYSLLGKMPLGKIAQPIVKTILAGTATPSLKQKAKQFGLNSLNDAVSTLGSLALNKTGITPLAAARGGSSTQETDFSFLNTPLASDSLP